MTTQAHVHAVNDGGWVVTAGDGEHAIVMDYPGPGAQGDLVGLTPLKVLLASLAGCSGNSVAALLRKMHQPVDAVEVDVRATRRDEHPSVYTAIALDFTVRGSGVDHAAVEKALALSEVSICPVWAMLRDGTPITASCGVVES
jgi:putative redox protein